jgi:NADPH-dependent curcumin reductase CurA
LFGSTRNKEGKLKQKEDVAIGLNAPKTIVRLFAGQNFGKQMLKIVDPPLEQVNLKPRV